MESDVAAGRLDALVLKLRHPLAKVRSRALHSLLFKLRERLVRLQELEPLQNSLIPTLLACLEAPLELDTLHVLQLLVQSQSEVLLASLQHFGAAQKLQRAANNNPELQSSYEKLLRQIYVTKLVSVQDEKMEQVSTSEEEEEVQEFRISKVLSDQRRAPKVDELEARGWKFAQVTLTSVDEQYLFEFEVKLQLRTEIQDIVEACATFRHELLRNFPAEVFLQRPAVLQYLLHLVQQPILPGSPETLSGESDVLMERAMEMSMGVSYFDEILNATFSHKRGNLSGAVVMASLKAIESFLHALKRTRRTCLDPTYVVHAPKVHVELFDSYDSRRVLYPRVSVEVRDDGSLSEQRGSDIVGLEQYSLSGAVYRIFMSILPMLRSARHPRLHLLNILITALPDLLEKGSTEASVEELDKMRLERILEILSGICHTIVLEQRGNPLIDDDLGLTYSMAWKLVELVLRLLRLYSSSQYYLEENSSKADSNRGHSSSDDKLRIVIPRLLWQAVKSWIANPNFSEVAAKEWNDESLLQYLSKVDGTIPAFVNLKQSSQRDARLILDFVEFAKAHREQLADFGQWEKPAIFNLEVVRKTIQTRYAFDDTDIQTIADATLQTIWSKLTSDTGKLADSDVEAIQFIFCDLLNDLDENKSSTSHGTIVAHFFGGLMDLLDDLSNETSRISSDRRRQFFSEIVCEPKFLTLLLIVLARHEDPNDQIISAAFWGILRAALNQIADSSRDKLLLFQPVIPLLQHFAYIEPSEGSSREQRSTQPQLAEVLNQVETIVPNHIRIFLICRCLLHVSSYIRKAAASGILRLLSQSTSATVDWIAKDKAIREDPFGGSFGCDDTSLETTLLETPLPVINTSDHQPSENELSSQLSKLSHLCRVISGTSSAFESMREAALKELVSFIDNSSVELFTLFEELDKFSDLMELLRVVLQTEPSQHDSSMAKQALLVFRTLLLRSRLLRLAMQRDCGIMNLLMPLIFHSSALIRAQMYYIILLLTCSNENFIPKGAPIKALDSDYPEVSDEAIIPEMIKSTFGLYSSRWDRCFITSCSLKVQLQASSSLLTKRYDAAWLQEVKTIINQASFRYDVDKAKRDSDQPQSLLEREYTHIVQKLRAAPSHGKCLNAIYHLMTICEAWRIARERFVGEWEEDFERYFAVPPKTERDEVIIGALVSTLSVVFCSMTRGEQLRAIVVVKRKVLPLLKRSQSKFFSLQVARLLLNVSESKIDNLFLSLAADTDIISTICTKYSAIYSTEPVLHSIMLEVLLRFSRYMKESADTHLSAPSREKICKRLVEMLSPLLTVVCHHRVPGSFLDRDVFVVGSQCMISILRSLPCELLLTSDGPLEHTDSNLLLDGSWKSRFLFDHVSPIRELGFLVIDRAASDFPSTRLLEMAFETSTDDTESDAVRSAACTALTKELLRFHERLPDQQAEMVEIFHGTTFAGRVLRSLSSVLKSHKLFVRASGAFAWLVRVLYVHRDTLAPHFGDIQQELKTAEDKYDVYPLLVQALSFREWKNKCNRNSSCCMLLPYCDDDAWRRSLLPAILDLIAEVMNLLQAICRGADVDQVAFFLTHTPLQYQLMQLVGDVHASFNDTLSVDTQQRHYDVFDLCAGTLSILLVKAVDQHNDHNSELIGAHTISGFGAQFVGVVVTLLQPQHPIDLRVSFSRFVTAVSLLIPGSLKSLDSSVISALGSAVLELYQEVAEFRPLDASTTTSDLQGRVFPLASIRRVSCAVQVLLETSPTIQQLVQIKRVVPFAIASIKDSFTAIRIAGGFGGKRPKSSMQGTHVLDLCGRIQTHMEVVSSIIGGDKEIQRLTKDEGLISGILSNWSVMKMAHARGSQLMLRSLQLLANYCYGNDSAKSSLLISLPLGPGKLSGGETVQTLLSLLFDLASTRGEVTSHHRITSGTNALSAADMALSNAACQVLKTVLLNAECVSASMKTGSISRLIDSLQDRLKQARQTSKTYHLENENLAHILRVISSIVCNEEGARLFYTNWATVLSLVFDDVMHLPDVVIRRNGCLLMRNLALSQVTKNHFALWEEMLDEMVALCLRVAKDDLTTLGYISTALWSLVYDNQKARALLLSRLTVLRNLQQMVDSQKDASASNDIAENLRRVLLLLQE